MSQSLFATGGGVEGILAKGDSGKANLYHLDDKLVSQLQVPWYGTPGLILLQLSVKNEYGCLHWGSSKMFDEIKKDFWCSILDIQGFRLRVGGWEGE